MKIGILSDIHGNLPALKAVLDALASRRVSEVVCLGDLVGYYPFVNEVIAEIRGIGAIVVRGNHDHAVVTGTPIPESISATATAEHARRTLSTENRRFLSSLPPERRMRLDEKEIVLFHGTPASPIHGRIRSREDVEPALAHATVALGGHTHIPAVIRHGSGIYVNPGSCGQPRDFDIRASCAVIDLDTMTVEIVREFYDIDAVFLGMQDLGFDSRIAWSLYTAEWVGSSVLSPASEMDWVRDLEGRYDRREYLYCTHMRNRRTSMGYTGYIQDGRAWLVTAPCHTDGRGTWELDRNRYKVRAGAVAACRALESDRTVKAADISEADARHRLLVGILGETVE